MLSPDAGAGPRFSIPFFQGVSYDSTFECVDVPAEVLAMRDEIREGRGKGGERTDDVEFTFEKGRWGHLGEATLANRVRSHPDVGEAWYPDLLAGIRSEQAKAQAQAQTREKSEPMEEGVKGTEKQSGRAVVEQGPEVEVH